MQTKTYTCIDWYTWFILIQVGNKSVVEKSYPKQPAILYYSRYSVPVYWCLWSCWIMSWSTSAIPHQARQVLERRPARTWKCACRTCTPWNTLELGIWEPRVITSVSLTMRYHETLHSSYVRDKQWFKVFQVDAEENLSEKVELSWWLKLLEGTKKQHASHWSRKSPNI